MTNKKSKNKSRTPVKTLKSVVGRKGTPDPRQKSLFLSEEEVHSPITVGSVAVSEDEAERSVLVVDLDEVLGLDQADLIAGRPVNLETSAELEEGPSGVPLTVEPCLMETPIYPNGDATVAPNGVDSVGQAAEQIPRSPISKAGPSGTKTVHGTIRRSRSRRPPSRGRSGGPSDKQRQKQSAGPQYQVKAMRQPTTARSVSRAAKRTQARAVQASLHTASWAELFAPKAPTPQQALRYIPPTVRDGKECVFMPATVPQQAMKRWQHTLVGYIIGRAVELRGLPGLLKDIWSLKGTVKVMPRGNGFHMFQFSNPAEIDKVMNGGPWFLQGKPLILRRWTPDSPFEHQRLSSIPLWVRFPGLPLKHWTVQGLSAIASAVGIPLFVDTPTANLTNISHARVCVEIDCMSPFPSKVDVFNEATGILEEVQVFYEWKPTPCTHCRTFGHYESSCIPSAVAKAKDNGRKVAGAGYGAAGAVKGAGATGARAGNGATGVLVGTGATGAGSGAAGVAVETGATGAIAGKGVG